MISGAGLYTAPASVSTQQTVSITATSVADPTKSATATVTLLPVVSVPVSPASAALVGGQQLQLSAIVSGSPANTGVIWSMTPKLGILNSSGLYMAPPSLISPQTVTITAISVADPSKSGSATISLLGVSLMPAHVDLGPLQSQRFVVTGAGLGGSVKWTITPSFGALTDDGVYVAPAIITTVQNVTIQGISTDGSARTASATVTIAPTGIAPCSVNLGPGESIQFSAKFAGVNEPFASWSIEPSLGSIAATTGFYLAPSSVAINAQLTVSAISALDPTKVARTVVTLLPFSIAPRQVTLGPGQQQQFTATMGGSPPVSWILTPPVGVVSQQGLYTAPATITTPQTVVLTAQNPEGGIVSAFVTLQPEAISPSAVTLTPGNAQQFSVRSSSGHDLPATWFLIPAIGSISSTGIYTAPTTVTSATMVLVTASPANNAGQTLSSIVTLLPSSPQLAGLECSRGSNVVTCTVKLTTPAPSAGVDVGLILSIAGGSTTGSIWHIPSGAMSSSFPVTILGADATLTATLGTSTTVELKTKP